LRIRSKTARPDAISSPSHRRTMPECFASRQRRFAIGRHILRILERKIVIVRRIPNKGSLWPAERFRGLLSRGSQVRVMPGALGQTRRNRENPCERPDPLSGSLVKLSGIRGDVLRLCRTSRSHPGRISPPTGGPRKGSRTPRRPDSGVVRRPLGVASNVHPRLPAGLCFREPARLRARRLA
jgi:hypothetical protein